MRFTAPIPQPYVCTPKLQTHRLRHSHNAQTRTIPRASAHHPPPQPSSPEEQRIGSALGFQVNERYLDWDDSAAKQLIRIHVAKEMNTTVETVHERLAELSLILPDLNNKLDKMKADLVLQLCRDTEAVAQRMVALREVLEGVDLGSLVASNPWLLTSPSVEELKEQLQRLKQGLPGVLVEKLVEVEPRLLTVDIEKVLKEIKRLLPSQDPVGVLVADPSIVLGMRDAGLKSSLAVDDGIEAD